jgi:hypothetical protein
MQTELGLLDDLKSDCEESKISVKTAVQNIMMQKQREFVKLVEEKPENIADYSN